MILTYLLAAFILMPIIELAVLLKVGTWLGPGQTVLLVILTGVAGAFLAREQGFRTVMAIQEDLARGRMPAPRLMDGIMILVAGVLLITPGLITDTVGFLLLVPRVRSTIRAWLRRKLEDRFQRGDANITVWRW
jgi:UPF0716 protein FxsA